MTRAVDGPTDDGPDEPDPEQPSGLDPTESGHSQADTLAERNRDDESPS